MIKYVHDTNAKMCIAYTPASTSMPPRKSEIFKMTTVLCHKQDQYKKAEARAIALENFNNGNTVVVRLPKGWHPHEYFQNLAFAMGGNEYEYE
jgi:hypothetical protein